jgi:hypothetical protein
MEEPIARRVDLSFFRDESYIVLLRLRHLNVSQVEQIFAKTSKDSELLRMPLDEITISDTAKYSFRLNKHVMFGENGFIFVAEEDVLGQYMDFKEFRNEIAKVTGFGGRTIKQHAFSRFPTNKGLVHLLHFLKTATFSEQKQNRLSKESDASQENYVQRILSQFGIQTWQEYLNQPWFSSLETSMNLNLKPSIATKFLNSLADTPDIADTVSYTNAIRKKS